MLFSKLVASDLAVVSTPATSNVLANKMTCCMRDLADLELQGRCLFRTDRLYIQIYLTQINNVNAIVFWSIWRKPDEVLRTDSK